MTMRKAFAIMLTFIMVLGVFPIAHADSEIPDGYIPIYTAEDLSNIRNDLDGKYILMNDINLTLYENWVPIGIPTRPFTGELNGNKFSINNLSLKSNLETEETNNLGFFGFVNSALIRNLNFNNVAVNVDFPYTSTYFIGCVAAYCTDSKIYSCKADGMINVVAGGDVYSGGIVGYVDDRNSTTEITGCTSEIKIDIIGKDESIFKPEVFQYTYVGGIAGFVDADVIINRCINNGDISVNSINVGIVGSVFGHSESIDISECVNSGQITSEGTCKINETPIGEMFEEPALWDRIVNLFKMIFEKIYSFFVK